MNKLLHCDCVNGMKDLDDGIIDLTVTSPPYDEVRRYDLLPMAKFKKVASELFRITKPGGVVVWVVQEQIRDGSQTGTSSEQRLYFRDIGFYLWDCLIMTRFGRRNAVQQRYGTPVEQAFILTKGKPCHVDLWRDKPNKSKKRVRSFHNRHADGTFNILEKKLAGSPFGVRPPVWRYPVGRHAAKEAWIRRAAHGAVMPEKMAEDLILCYSRPGDLVFDPMAGLGTTCKMAMLNHRRYLGMEINEKYFQLAEQRMKLAKVTYRQRLHHSLAACGNHE